MDSPQSNSGLLGLFVSMHSQLELMQYSWGRKERLVEVGAVRPCITLNKKKNECIAIQNVAWANPPPPLAAGELQANCCVIRYYLKGGWCTRRLPQNGANQLNRDSNAGFLRHERGSNKIVRWKKEAEGRVREVWLGPQDHLTKEERKGENRGRHWGLGGHTVIVGAEALARYLLIRYQPEKYLLTLDPLPQADQSRRQHSNSGGITGPYK